MNIATEGAQDEGEEGSSRWTLFKRFFGASHKDAITSVNLKTNQLAENLSNLSNTRISDVATPRAEIVALPLDADAKTFFETLKEHGYSRLPVYEETLDDPTGIVHVKDVFMNYADKRSTDKFALKPFVRDAIYAPPSMRVSALLQKMQNDRKHMAFLIDEFGGVEGLVTIEDLLEQIVGDITDEHDETEELWTKEKSGVYVAQARTLIDEFESDTNITLPKPEEGDDVDTLGGLIITIASRLPVKGEVIKTSDGHEFEIVDADPRRINKIRIRLPQLSKNATD